MTQSHRKLVTALKRERARRKALHARARFLAQRRAATERMQRARLLMKQRSQQARHRAAHARRRAEARRRAALR